MGKKLIITLLGFIPLLALGQEQEVFLKDKLLKSSATIAPGTKDNIFLHGHTEFFTEERVSIRGDIYANVTSPNQKHAMFFGANYHFLKSGNFDPYVGLQPGMGTYKPLFTQTPPKITLVPLMGITGGCNYYVGEYFNFFASAMYLRGTAMSSADWRATSMDEVIVSAGLGFNFSLKKK